MNPTGDSEVYTVFALKGNDMKACKFCSTRVEDSVTHCPSCGSNVFLHICENCGKAFDSSFCPNCGTKAGQKKKICPDCGTAYFSNACPNCGYMPSRKPAQQEVVHTQEIVHKHVYVNPQPAPTPTQARRTRKRSRGCGCLTWIIIIILVGSFFAGRNASRQLSSGSTSRTTTSTSKTTARKTSTETAGPTATPEPAVAAAQKKVDLYFKTASQEEIKGVQEALSPFDSVDAKKAGKVLLVHRSAYGDRGTLFNRKAPDYVGDLGYAAVSADQKLKDNADFASTPWKVPVYRKDKQFWEEDGSIDHKAEVVVIGQELEEPRNKYGSAKCTGYLHVIRMDTGKDCWLDVKNYVTGAYWELPLTEAWEKGFCIAEFRQKSDYYPVTKGKAKVEIEDGTLVLVPMKNTTYSTSPDKTNNPLPAYVFREWKYGYGGVDVFFNTADLSIKY